MSSGLFSALASTPAMREVVSDRAWDQAMLDAEAALASANAAAAVIPPEAAVAIADACRAEDFDVAALRDATPDGGNPVIPLVRALRAATSSKGAAFVHFGATSQDIQDTAMMLVLRRGLELVVADLDRACRACADLARRHRDTLITARTLLQPALPTTFGLKAANWLDALLDARDGLLSLRQARLAAQLGGAAGTLAAFGPRAAEVAAAFAAELALLEPTLPWHTSRARVAQVAAALGIAAGACDKLALDVGLLAQAEVGEVREGRRRDRGGSSTLPQTRNAVGVVAVRAAARGALGSVGVLLSGMAQEHERALGAWQGEAGAMTELLLAADAAAAGAADVLASLEVDARRMAANLAATRGLVMAESVTIALAPSLGLERARELVTAACERADATGRSLREELGVQDAATLDAALDPSRYLGAAGLFVDRALARFDATCAGKEDR